MTIALYILLAALSTLYAVVLELYAKKKRWEPDYTWVEVVLGVVLCLAVPFVLARTVGGDWQDYEFHTWLAFAVGGTPIVIWQLWRAERNKRQTQDAIKYLLNEEYLRDADRTHPLAQQRRDQPGRGQNHRSGR